ncbi:hypothetical protein SRABI106_02825 [Rahnella aquatilis]|nr:hypothetical protein SRABI106_02825 [Rahnella aquatilis]
MTRRAIALQHAMAVTENADTVMAVETATFGVGDTLVSLQRRLFSTCGQFDAAIRIQLFRVE